ncbi:MAG: sodium-dependent transporter [Bacteroidales bacterium]|jgi:NSS family neurotransmitter:Na+ symporter|nr:sodium-dependent transporter [Bacteroidales bacterium]
MTSRRDNFSGRFGIIAAAAGSAIGLGNVWRFPYVCGQNGGGAFLLLYLICIVLIGLPIMLAEFGIGRRAQSNAYRAFKKLSPKSHWYLVGVMGIVAAFVILSFYSAVGGWTIEYIIRSATNTLSNDTETAFNSFVSGGYQPILYQLFFLILTLGIVVMGVKKGIERSSKILMPLLLLLLIILCVRSVTLPGASEGLSFLLKPDFSKLSGNSILLAMGQAFFSLSLGMGCLITYGSYIKRSEDLTYSAGMVAGADTLIAVLAGIAIFPAAAAFGISAESGPGLVFITLPNVFQQMAGGAIFSTFFFILLCIAALTSSISLLEVVVSFCVEEMHMKRVWATVSVTACVFALGILCSLSLGLVPGIQLFGKSFFDLMDFAASNLLLPVGGLFISIYVGWVLKKRITVKELTNDGTKKMTYLRVFFFLIRYVVPVAILMVFIFGLVGGE